MYTMYHINSHFRTEHTYIRHMGFSRTYVHTPYDYHAHTVLAQVSCVRNPLGRTVTLNRHMCLLVYAILSMLCLCVCVFMPAPDADLWVVRRASTPLLN